MTRSPVPFMPHWRTAAAALAGLAACGPLAGSAARADATTRISLTHDGQQPDGQCRFPSLARGGRLLFFESAATNLVPGDTNGALDVFCRDLLTGAVVRVSVAHDGAQGDADSGHDQHTSAHATSDDGRFVAFYSHATNLVPGDTNGHMDVFLHDRDADENGVFDEADPGGITTIRINLGPGGVQADAGSGPHGLTMTPDGRFVTFYTLASNLDPLDTNVFADVFVYDRESGALRMMSRTASGVAGNGDSFHPELSDDGRLVAFFTEATNLFPGDVNGRTDVVILDRDPDENGVFDEDDNTFELISQSADGGQGNLRSRYSSISGDGARVIFETDASNLVPGDANNAKDILLRDRPAGTTTLLSVSTTGAQGNDDNKFPQILSRDGTLALFRAASNNLVPGDTNNRRDIYLRNLAAAPGDPGFIERLSVTTAGVQANGHSEQIAISRNNRYVAFDTLATNLADGAAVPDTNATWDIFLRDRGPDAANYALEGGCAGDVTFDGLVNFDDLNAVLQRWGLDGPGADADASGTVDFGDLNRVLEEWGAAC